MSNTFLIQSSGTFSLKSSDRLFFVFLASCLGCILLFENRKRRKRHREGVSICTR